MKRFCLSDEKQQGFILNTLFFFLLVVDLIVFSMLNVSYSQLHISGNYAAASQQFYAAEAGLKFAEDQIDLNKKFLQGIDYYAGYQIQYRIQRLNLLFCKAGKIAYFYRVTVQAKKDSQQPLTLQTTYAKKSDAICTGKEEKLNREGRSSWREC